MLPEIIIDHLVKEKEFVYTLKLFLKPFPICTKHPWSMSSMPTLSVQAAEGIQSFHFGARKIILSLPANYCVQHCSILGLK